MEHSREGKHRGPTAVRQALSWLWALAPAVSLGFATAPCMLVAAFRLRHWAQGALAGLYVVGICVMLAAAGAPEGSTKDVAFEAALALNMFVGLGNGIAVRKRMFFHDEGHAVDGPESAAPARSPLEDQRAALAGLNDTIELRRRARDIATSEPSHAVELRIGRIDLAGRAFPDGGLVDVNNVPIRLVAQEIPVLAPYADRLERARDEVRAFASVEDLSVTLALPADLLDHVQDRLVLLPRYEP